MLDSDLAELYGVETRALNQAVTRNVERFPEDFMLTFTLEEARASRSQNVILKRGENIKYRPRAFTEHGILLLSSILKSATAIHVSIQIIRVFAVGSRNYGHNISRNSGTHNQYTRLHRAYQGTR
jgi:hypothetical protein